VITFFFIPEYLSPSFSLLFSPYDEPLADEIEANRLFNFPEERSCHFIFILGTLYTSLINPPRERNLPLSFPSRQGRRNEESCEFAWDFEEGLETENGGTSSGARRVEGLASSRGFTLLTGYRDV